MEPSPSLPEQRMTSMLHDTGVKHVVVDAKSNPEISISSLVNTGFNLVYISIGGDGASGPLEKLERTTPPDRSHILFTSGSTGKPKPVQIRAHRGSCTLQHEHL
jgi:acyl-coenzyme A synthetase/AMP-(fatty) acid ligase